MRPGANHCNNAQKLQNKVNHFLHGKFKNPLELLRNNIQEIL